jgi:hypothetical protein
MKRVVLFAAAFLLLPAVPVHAKGHNARPRVNIASIVAHPATGDAVEHRITIEAFDPDGVIGELAVDFGDGVMVFILLACDPDTARPGDPVIYEIDWTYAPGKYKVAAWGYSTPECFSGEFQESRKDKARLKVA